MNSAANAPEWVNAPSGVVKNVVYAHDNSARNTTSSTPVTASNTLGVTITPTSTSSKIYVCFNFTGGNTLASHRQYYHIFRDSSDLGIISSHEMGGGGGVFKENPTTVATFDLPGSTSAITYTIRIATQGGNAYIGGGGSKGMGMAIEYLL